MKFQSPCTYNYIGISYFFKDLDRRPETGFSYIPASIFVVLDTSYVSIDFFPNKSSAFFFCSHKPPRDTSAARWNVKRVSSRLT